MDEKQITDEQKKELFNAISKLSEEDQLQIAGGGVISDKQCAKLQLRTPTLVGIDYGGPMPRAFPTPDVIIKVMKAKVNKEIEQNANVSTSDTIEKGDK